MILASISTELGQVWLHTLQYEIRPGIPCRGVYSVREAYTIRPSCTPPTSPLWGQLGCIPPPLTLGMGTLYLCTAHGVLY